MRVGIIGLMHESNTFLPTPTTIESFRSFHLLTGDKIRDAYAAAHHELGGFFAGLQAERIEAVPILGAWAMPGGAITADACDELVRLLFTSLDESGVLDGLLVAPHGAAVGEQHRDFDGHWLTLLRERVGAGVPIIGTLDPHANLSMPMVAACEALTAYRSNPHLDQRARGLEAAALMARTLRGEIRPTMAACLPPISINIERQLTSASPCRELYALADEQLTRAGVLSNSVLLGFPYSDVSKMGSAFLAVTDNDQAAAQKLADEMGNYLWRHRRDFVGQLLSVQEAVTRLSESPSPVGLLDMGDNIGGGSPGDSTLLLDALIRAGAASTFVALYDPAAVEQAARAGRGAALDLALGGKTDRNHGPTLHDRVTVLSLHDGKFSEHEPRHGGQTNYNMGPTAVVRLSGGQTVMITSRRMAPFSLSQLTSCGIRPADYRAIIIKGVHAPVAAYAPVCQSLIRVDTPGVTRADMTKLDFKHRRRPLFPFDEIAAP